MKIICMISCNFCILLALKPKKEQEQHSFAEKKTKAIIYSEKVNCIHSVRHVDTRDRKRRHSDIQVITTMASKVTCYRECKVNVLQGMSPLKLHWPAWAWDNHVDDDSVCKSNWILWFPAVHVLVVKEKLVMHLDFFFSSSGNEWVIHSFQLHVFKLVNPSLGVALPNLPQRLVFVPSLSHVFLM